MSNARGRGSLEPIYQQLSPVTSLLLCPCMPLSPHSTPSLTCKTSHFGQEPSDYLISLPIFPKPLS